MKRHFLLLATLLLSASMQAERAYPRIEGEYTAQTTTLSGHQLQKANFDLDKALLYFETNRHIKQTKAGAFFQIISEQKKIPIRK